MASFVLVPGAMHGAWMWERLTPLLEAAGHTVIARDLPGMGDDRSIALEDVTLDDWATSVAAQVREAAPPVILAGHSRGGLVIGDAAERMTQWIQGLIYIAAVIVPPGMLVSDLPGGGDNRPAGGVARTAGVLDAAMATAMFYNRCEAKDAAWAAGRLCPEPMRPLATPASVSWERWGRLPRAYIECTEDRTLRLERQRLLQSLAPCNLVVRLDSDHSPFLSAPTALAEAMIAIARSFAADARLSSVATD